MLTSLLVTGGAASDRAWAVAPSVLLSSDFATVGSWVLKSGAVADPLVSAGAGSGSVRLPSQAAAAWSPPVAVRPGVLYGVRVKVRQDSWPRGTVSISIQQSTPEGQWIRSLPPGTATAPFVNGQFGESGLYFSVDADVPHIQVLLIRSLEQASNDPMWIDDVQLVESPSIDIPRSQKSPFEGEVTRIDAYGNWQVRNGSKWLDWFPICAAINPTRTSVERLTTIAKQGIDCNIWNGMDEPSLQRHKAAGLRSFFQLSQYTNPKGWAVGDLADLQAKISAATSSSAGDYLAGYYLDAENQWASVTVTKQVLDRVKELDVDPTSSKRRRPVVQLQGNYGSVGLWSDENGQPFTDAVGAYVPIGESGGAGSGPGGQSFLETQPGQTQPSALCQINDGVGVRFRAALFACIAHGSRFASYWGDGPVDPRFPDVPDLERQPFWPDLPAIHRDLGLLSNVVRANPATDWSATTETSNELLPVTMGRRTVEGLGHLIISNLSPDSQVRRVTVRSLPYAPGEVREAITNQLLARVAPDGTFSLTIPGAGIGSGGLVVRIVPAGWKRPLVASPGSTTAAPPTAPKKTTSTSKRAGASVRSRAGSAFAVTGSKLATVPGVCSGGVRLEAEAASIKGRLPTADGGFAREWALAGAPSALDWSVKLTGSLRFRIRYMKTQAGVAKRTLFAVLPNGTWVSKQFDLPSTRGAWSAAEVDLDVPRTGSVGISASFDVLTDTEDIDAVDYVEACPR